jgi:AraC-like DNA-binding protein
MVSRYLSLSLHPDYSKLDIDMDEMKLNIGKIVNAEQIAADYSVGYSDDDIILVTNAKLLAEPNPVRLEMNAVVLCTQGKAQMQLNGKATILAVGQMLVCPPNTSLTNFMLSPDFEFKAIFVSGRMLQSFLRERMKVWTQTFYVEKEHVVTIDEEDTSLLSSFYDTLYIFLYSKKERRVKGEVLQSFLRGAFLCLCEHLETMSGSDDSQEKPRPANSLFQQFLGLLGSTPVKHRPVEWYASELCITPKYLSAVCKSSSGKTANEWIREHVLEDIRYYLKSTDLSIKQVSTKLGFPNTSFFGKYVKEHFGMTPFQLRQNNV